MIGMVEAEVERDGKTSVARRYYLSSAPLTAAAFAAAVRAHWGIENRLHWVMDVVFHDDLMRLRTGAGPANMATIRHAALNIVKEIPDKASLKVRRKTLGWDDDYLLAALTPPPNDLQAIPLGEDRAPDPPDEQRRGEVGEQQQAHAVPASPASTPLSEEREAGDRRRQRDDEHRHDVVGEMQADRRREVAGPDGDVGEREADHR